MDWLGESLTNIKGQISSFTKDVLTPEPMPNSETESSDNNIVVNPDDVERIKTYNVHLNELCKQQHGEIELLKSKSLELEHSLESNNRQLDSYKEVIHAKEVENEQLRKQLLEVEQRSKSLIHPEFAEARPLPISGVIPYGNNITHSNCSDASTKTDQSYEELVLKDLEDRCNAYQNDLYLLRAELMAVQRESDQKDEYSAKFQEDLLQFLLSEFNLDGQSVFPRSIKSENGDLQEQLHSWLKELAYLWRDVLEKKSTLERQVTRLSLAQSFPSSTNSIRETDDNKLLPKLSIEAYDSELFYPAKTDTFGLETIVEEERSEDEGARSDSTDRLDDESLLSPNCGIRARKGTPSPVPTVFSSNCSTQTDPESADELKVQLSETKHIESSENKVHELEIQNQNLQMDLDRLKTHLVDLEEQYTNEALANEEKIKLLQDQTNQLKKELSKTSHQNEHCYDIRDEISKLAEEITMYKRANGNLEEQVQKLNSQLQNLYFVLEQFQKEKENEIKAVEDRFKAEILKLKKKNEMLSVDLEKEEALLEKAKSGLNAAHQLNIQLEEKARIIQQLKSQVREKDNEISKLQKEMDEVAKNIGGKVDRYLIKNLFVGYFSTPSDKKNEVLRVIATVLDFNREDRQKTGLESSTSLWPFNKFSSNPSKDSQSLSEAFIHFLENESNPKIQLKMSVDERTRRNSKSSGPATSAAQSIFPEANTITNRDSSPIPTVSEISMELPVLAQSDRSNSILKDVLSPKP